MSGHEYPRYLSSKKTVDDRALNKDVVECLRGQLAAVAAPRLQVIEVGAGVGTMVARMLEWQLLTCADYLLLDVDAESLEASKAWLTRWARARGHRVEVGFDDLHIGGPGIDVQVRLVCAELSAFLASGAADSSADLLIASALLDLVDLASTLPALLELASPGALFWFSLNFDGETILEPEHPLDGEFMRVYHRSMDERERGGRPAGDSRTGRHLFSQLRRAGAEILAAGSSDWLVFAGKHGYPDDEAYFLHHIVRTIDEELARQREVDAHERARWVQLRHAQIDAAELVYVAHQLDFVGRTPTGHRSHPTAG